jgi:hypothetical protein
LDLPKSRRPKICRDTIIEYAASAAWRTSALLQSTKYYMSRIADHVAWGWSWALLCLSAASSAALPAFPGAEGFGANASGGRGGDVYYVTNLHDYTSSADSGRFGSLRYGIESAPTNGRTILFKVPGNIVLKKALSFSKPKLTVAGQSAPGDGICLQDYNVAITANDLVLRHLRFRLGTNAMQEADSLSITGGTNIVVDHCSVSWSVDETLSPGNSAQNLTVQWTYVTESLNNSIHSKGAHGYGSLMRPQVSTSYSFHHNLYAHHNSRNPRPGSYNGATLQLDWRNTVIYNWGGTCGYSGDWTDGLPEPVFMNYVANYIIRGPSSTSTSAFNGGGTNTWIFQATNRIDLNRNGTPDGSDTGWGMFSGTYTATNTPFVYPAVATDSAAVALGRVLAQAGAMPWRRDAVDQRVTGHVRTGTGQIIDSTPQVGSWPTLNSVTPPVDTDSDGMPDYWELALGLIPANAADRNAIGPSGYTRLEDYLNWLSDPHAVCDRNGKVEVNLRECVGYSSNLTFTVTRGTNGTAALLADGFTARFTATPNFTGVAGFTFYATANGTTFGPSPVGILISTTNAPNTAPKLEPITNRVVLGGATLTFTNQASDAESAWQTLTFSLLDAPAGATVGADTGVFAWRPNIAQSGTSNAMRVVVSDNGVPSLSATQGFAVSVITPASPQFGPTVFDGAQFGGVIQGDAGPDYVVQASTNLEDWTRIFAVASPLLPLQWRDTNAGDFGRRFYRIQLGP